MHPIFVGISGWNFEGWRGTFYPEGLKQDQELSYASRKLRSIEVNGTFYSLFKPNSYQKWYAETPADFSFSIKGPKYITHERRLKEFERPLANFMASGILALKEKMGPILWQFPPNLKFDPERFEPFMKALPHDMEAAAKIGEGHSDWMKERLYLQVDGNCRMRHAIEGRHESFRCPEFVNMCRRYGIAIVIGDTAGRWPLIEDVCTDFLYLRLHADEVNYPEGYPKAALERWVDRFRSWAAGGQPTDAAVVMEGNPLNTPRNVYAYFDNDAKETAPLNALSAVSLLLQQKAVALREFSDLPVPGQKTRKVADAAKEVAKKKKKVGATKRPSTVAGSGKKKKVAVKKAAPAKKRTKIVTKKKTAKKKKSA